MKDHVGAAGGIRPPPHNVDINKPVRIKGAHHDSPDSQSDTGADVGCHHRGFLSAVAKSTAAGAHQHMNRRGINGRADGLDKPDRRREAAHLKALAQFEARCPGIHRDARTRGILHGNFYGNGSTLHVPTLANRAQRTRPLVGAGFCQRDAGLGGWRRE